MLISSMNKTRVAIATCVVIVVFGGLWLAGKYATAHNPNEEILNTVCVDGYIHVDYNGELVKAYTDIDKTISIRCDK